MNKRPDKMKPTNHSTKSNRHISRRRFVSNLAAAAAGTAALATPSGAKGATPADQPSPGDSVDVLVVGGGTAGTVAAIQAARAGAAQFGPARPNLPHGDGAGRGCRRRARYERGYHAIPSAAPETARGAETARGDRAERLRATRQPNTTGRTPMPTHPTTMDVAVNPTFSVNAPYGAGKEMSGKNWKAEA